MLGGSAHTDDDSAPAALIRRDTTPTAAGSGTAPIAPVESAPVESAVESAPVEIAPAEATRSPGPRATHTRHVRDKAIAKPVDKPVDKPIDKPVDKPIDKPRPVDDDDAVRSPFSHK